MKKTIYYALFAIILFCTRANAQSYTIHNEFGNFSQSDTLSKGPFLLWWDKKYPFPQASTLLDNMIDFASDCYNNLNMSYPPNSLAGAYVDIYCHSSGANDYLNQYVSGNGVGTENYYTKYQGPYYTSGRNTLTYDYSTVAHETFHLMQYNQNSPGYVYSGNSMWYTEACASFYGMTRYPDSGYEDVYILRRLPQVPLWLSSENLGKSSYPQNWQRVVRQYALNIFMYYMYKEKNVPIKIFTDGYYAHTNLLPQQYIASKIGIQNFRNYFIEFATMLHNNYDFIPGNQLSGALNNFNTYADPNDIHEYVLQLNNVGTNGWYRPGLNDVTTGWSSNCYKISNNQNRNYMFEINGDAMGSYGNASNFKGRILVKNSKTNSKFYDVPMTSITQGKITLTLTPDDYEVDFVVASLPDRLEDDKPEFQTYGYQVKISVVNGVTNCTGSTTDASWEYINRVQLGNIDNPSTATTYSDFTSKSTSALRGSTMNIAVTIGNVYPADKVLIWCDWNNDKIFDPTTELAATLDSITSGPNPYKGSITIPANAFLGKIKMRIKMLDDANGPDYDPCGTTGYGEVEDYTLNCTDNISSIDPTGSDNQNQPFINVYPNPNNGAFTLDISFPDNGSYNVEIANVLGQIVYTEALNINNRNYNFSKQFNLNELSKGVYIVKINGNGINTNKKIIVE